MDSPQPSFLAKLRRRLDELGGAFGAGNTGAETFGQPTGFGPGSVFISPTPGTTPPTQVAPGGGVNPGGATPTSGSTYVAPTYVAPTIGSGPYIEGGSGVVVPPPVG